MSDPVNQRRPTEDAEPYTLIYWPGIPGRGEFIRLAFVAAGVEYTDTPGGAPDVMAQISEDNLGDSVSPPSLAPPILKHGDVVITQTPNILLYLGAKLGLVPPPDRAPNGTYFVHALTLTALDGLSNEPHDVHHPIAPMLYYEDQKDEARRKAADYRTNRLPKFLAYFERVLRSPASGGGEYLYGGQLTYADLVLFQTVDGVSFAYPKCMEKLRQTAKYDRVFSLYERVKNTDKVKAYLASDRRQQYGMGIYRHYPELDDP